MISLRRFRAFWAVALVSCWVGVGCGGGATPTLEVTASSTDVGPGDTVTLTVAVTNITLADPSTNTPDTGYLQVYLDDKTGNDFLARGFSNSIEVTVPADLSAGDHTLRVQLMKSDQTPYEPKVEKVVNLKVTASNPSIEVTADKTKVKPGDQVTLTVKVTGIKLVPPASNTVNKKGEGHYHVAFDDDDPEQTYASLGHTETVKVTIPLSITAGAHKMHVYLMNNNHSKYTPEVKGTVDFEITQSAPPTLQISLNKQTAAPGDTVILKVSVTNFQLTKIADSPQKKPGQGHYHVLLGDGNPEDSKVYIAANHRETLELAIPNNTPTGPQKLVVYLMNNDHTKYTPETKASVDLEIVGKGQPTVNISVDNTDIVAGEEFQLTVKVENFKLTPISNNPVNKSGEGHYHVVLDDAKPEQDYLTPAADETTKIKMPANITPGPHKLVIYLMNNDHTLYKPEAKASIDITVLDPNAPRVSLSIDKSSVKAGDKINVTVTTTNFKLVKIGDGTGEVKGEGHYHLAFDNNDPEATYITATHEPSVTITVPSSLPAGKHKLWVYLMYHNHKKYAPEVKASVEFEVAQ